MQVTLKKEEIKYLLREIEQFGTDILVETSPENRTFLFFRTDEGEKSLIGIIGESQEEV